MENKFVKKLLVNKGTQEKFGNFFSDIINYSYHQKYYKNSIQTLINKGYTNSEIQVAHFLLYDLNKSFCGICTEVSIPKHFTYPQDTIEVGPYGYGSYEEGGGYQYERKYLFHDYSYTRQKNHQGSILKAEFEQLIKENETIFDFVNFAKNNIIWIGLALWILGYLISKVF